MKHAPLRTCVACRSNVPKRELVRIVRTSPDTVQVDRSGKLNGRGAYLCPAQECWRLAESKRSLNHALEMTVSAADWQALWEYAAGLPAQKVLKRAERTARVHTAPDAPALRP
jgi:predicted RNA-binding protein YlxR (DUF448 family)